MISNVSFTSNVKFSVKGKPKDQFASELIKNNKAINLSNLFEGLKGLGEAEDTIEITVDYSNNSNKLEDTPVKVNYKNQKLGATEIFDEVDRQDFNLYQLFERGTQVIDTVRRGIEGFNNKQEELRAGINIQRLLSGG